MGFRNPDPNRSKRRSLRSAGVTALIILAVVAFKVSTGTKTDGAGVREYTINSHFVNGDIEMDLVAPQGKPHGRPLLVFLHGRGGDQSTELTDPFFAALRALGPNAPDVAFPAGNDHSYWHNRLSGDWGSYVLQEVIPDAIKALGADGSRVAIGGVSMGGFGAYDIARLAPSRFCAVGGHSTAMWTSGGLSPSGAFDDAADFARNDVIALAQANPELYGHARLWLDVGSQDPFRAADQDLASALHISLHVWPGGHSSAYTEAHWIDYLRFYARALSTCRTP